MAAIAPNDVTRLALGGRRRREVETLLALQSRLPDDYTVYHGVHWTREHRGDTAYGEIDFAVVNRAGHVLVIEQKNGTLEETDDGDLLAHYAERTRSVAGQVHRALDGLREKFRRHNPGAPGLHLDYLVYCPEHRLVHINSAALDGSRIVDAADRDGLPGRIAGVLGLGDDGPHAERVHAFFRQTFDLVPDVHSYVTGHERSFARLNGQLVTLLDGLEMTPLRLRVRGVAGCGKTMIARHQHDRAIRAGRRALLVCFNRPLAERLRAAVSPGGHVNTWYGLCAAFLEERGHRLDFAAMATDRSFWDRVHDLVVAEAVPDRWRFDTLIVDEGQDFEPLWVEMLELFRRPDADVLWLEDPYQNLRDQPPAQLGGFVGFSARVNYRSPRSIARFMARALPAFGIESGSDLPGLGVMVTPYERPEDQPALVGKVVARLLRRGFRAGDIAVLTTRHMVTPGAARSVFADLERVGSFTLRRFTGQYDLLGNQVLSPGQLTLDSVTRFKGQEAPAVIVVDVDPAGEDPARFERLLFSAMTRATVRLELLVRGGTDLVDRLLEAQGRS
jgi:hypothetical protein